MANIAVDREREEEIPISQLRRFYELMLLTRTFDSQAVNLQRQGRIGFYVPCEGEEAAEVGSALALRPADWLFPDYRASGVMISRGMALDTILAQLMASSEDISKGRSMPSHYGSRALNTVPPSSPLCTQLPHAVGVALAAKIRGDDIATMAYFGDGGTSSNDFHSALNFAAVFKTPTVFFCRNNGYAISTPVTQQTATDSLAIKASAYGIEGVRVDGNDVMAVYAATKMALEKARSGGGPTLIEAVTYRIGAHSTSDDPTRYRDPREVELMRSKDPVARFGDYLRERGVWTDEDESDARQSMHDLVKEAVARAEKFPHPDVRSLFDDVYSEQTWNLRAEADELAEEIGGY
ncbi:MAG: pyruvate dehydrogenase (acetyl-transferring) E1 component subunit alpha [Nitrososphaerales archaeon]|jgi:pyruvate dehydrogenase E1 component alpha subunit